MTRHSFIVGWEEKSFSILRQGRNICFSKSELISFPSKSIIRWDTSWSFLVEKSVALCLGNGNYLNWSWMMICKREGEGERDLCGKGASAMKSSEEIANLSWFWWCWWMMMKKLMRVHESNETYMMTVIEVVRWTENVGLWNHHQIKSLDLGSVLFNSFREW